MGERQGLVMTCLLHIAQHYGGIISDLRGGNDYESCLLYISAWYNQINKTTNADYRNKNT